MNDKNNKNIVSPFVDKQDIVYTQLLAEMKRKINGMESTIDEYKKLSEWRLIKKWRLRRSINRQMDEINKFMEDAMNEAMKIALEVMSKKLADMQRYDDNEEDG